MVGYRDINFDSHPQFSKQYLLRAFDEDDLGNEFSRYEEASTSAFKESKNEALVRDLFTHSYLIYWKPIRGSVWRERGTNLF